jgi:hypothetical protein
MYGSPMRTVRVLGATRVVTADELVGVKCRRYPGCAACDNLSVNRHAVEI